METDNKDWEEGRKEMEKKIKEVLEEIKNRKGKRREGKEGWWNDECRRKKREVRRELKK